MLKAKALYDCTADDIGELSFKAGDELVDIAPSVEDGWYEGRIKGTSFRGLFPYNYVEFIPEIPETPATKIQNQPSVDTSKNAYSLSVSPPNSTISSAWSVISNKDHHGEPTQDVASVTGEASLVTGFEDAFDAAIRMPLSAKSADKPPPAAASANKPAPWAASAKKPRPLVSPKPAQLYNASTPIKKEDGETDLVLKKNPPVLENRARSLSASAAWVHSSSGDIVKPSSLRKDYLAKKTLDNSVPIIRPKAYNANPTNVVPKMTPLPTDVSEDTVDTDEGFQLVKPSQLKQRAGHPAMVKLPTATAVVLKETSKSIGSTVDTSKAAVGKQSTKLASAPPANNPAPRLPSRPSPQRRSKSVKIAIDPSSSLSTPLSSSSQSGDKPKPMLKPKPAAISPRVKGRSISNPPPIQPKPDNIFKASMPTTASKDIQNASLDSPVHKVPKNTPPTSVALPGLAGLTKPALPQATKPVAPALPVRPVHTEDVNIKPSELKNRKTELFGVTRLQTTPFQAATDLKKKNPPPPPPSRMLNQLKPAVDDLTDKYKLLFEAIHDDGLVDGDTVRIIWKRSKLPDEKLMRIWSICDPQSKGALDKEAFILGMRHIDAYLKNWYAVHA